MYKHLDVNETMLGLYDLEHVNIVDGYLIAHHIGSPWYSSSTFLSEALVLKLSGDSDFSVVPKFLTGAGREAGASLAIAGTALASADRALASLYQRDGFSIEALTLTKEL